MANEMNLSRGAQEAIRQAQKMRLETGADNLCAEHIFYGLLRTACYLEEPLNDPEYLWEVKELRSFLEENMGNLESTIHQLKREAIENRANFKDAAPLLGRAAELASKGEVGTMELARAALESSTPIIAALRWAREDSPMKEDERYRKNAPEKHVISEEDNTKKAGKQENGGATPSQILALLLLLAASNERQKSGLLQNAGKRNRNIRRKTKLGFFTYRGGTVAAAVQYFLFGFLIPFAVLAGLEMATGAVSEPATPLAAFLIDTFIILWGFYLFRGAALLLGLISNAFGLFLQILSDLALIAALTLSVQDAWNMPEVPTWLRIVSCVSTLIILLIGVKLYEFLKSEGDITKTRINLGNVTGTPGKIFFKTLTKEMIYPLLIFAVIWISRREQPLWAQRCYWIAGFLWIWNVFHIMNSCLVLRNQESRRRHKGRRLAKFMLNAHVLLIIPELVLFLHWLFGWFPMKIWVIVLLSVYTTFALLSSLLVSDRRL